MAAAVARKFGRGDHLELMRQQSLLDELTACLLLSKVTVRKWRVLPETVTFTREDYGTGMRS